MKFDFTIKTEHDMENAVNTLGVVPLFRNSIPGFSIEEHAAPECWFSDEQDGVWEWKGPVIQKTRCAYGKFFEKKAAFVRADIFCDLANYRRDGYDFDARYDDGLAPFQDKELFDLIDQNAPLHSKTLKKLGNYGKDGKKGFDTSMNRLQEQGYVIISDFVYMLDKTGRQYGWGVAEYSTPEKYLGETFFNRVYSKATEESYAGILSLLHELCPNAGEAMLKKFLK